MVQSQTIAGSFQLDGIGIHTGTATRVDVRPARRPHGRVFIRNGTEIPALADFVIDTRRSTTLGRGPQSVSTVEHLLAALMLAGIDHVEIHVDGQELPALDGSASQWYSAICSAGVCPLGGEVNYVRIANAEWFRDGESEFFVLPADDLRVYAALAIPDTVAERMVAGGSVFQPAVRGQIIRARTFGLEWEVQALLDAGLARGGSLDNAVILTRTGYLNAEVHPDEPAWHKVLDLCGDLALVGARLAGQLLAIRNGHRSNVALAERLRRQYAVGDNS